MEYKKIEKLLEKYWNGETSLQEEQQLRHFFQSPKVPGHLKNIAPLFQYYQKETEYNPLGKPFEEKVLNKVSPGTATRSRALWNNLLKVAASLLIIGLTVYYLGFNREQEDTVAATTIEDPELAYEKTKMALLLVSEKLNTGEKYTREMEKLGEARSLFAQEEN